MPSPHNATGWTPRPVGPHFHHGEFGLPKRSKPLPKRPAGCAGGGNPVLLRSRKNRVEALDHLVAVPKFQLTFVAQKMVRGALEKLGHGSKDSVQLC